MVQDLLKLRELPFLIVPFAVFSVVIHVFKMEDHVQFTGILAGILLRKFGGDARSLAHRHYVIF